jgi:hypothetical protein
MTRFKRGKPALFDNCLDLDAMCQLYFDDADAKGFPYTVPDLALFLGFSGRQALYDYEHVNKNKHDYAYTIKRAKSRIEAQRVRSLIEGKGHPAGRIFDLKNNFGYKDKQDIETNVTGGITINLVDYTEKKAD